MRRAACIAVATTAALGGVMACTDVTDIRLLEIGASGTLAGELYLDLDGDEARGPADRPIPAAPVILTTAGSDAPIATDTTDGDGRFAFEALPAGSYRLRVDDSVLGDTLATPSSPVLEVVLGGTLDVAIRASFPELTVEELRVADAGRRVFTTGIALNVRDNPADGRVFLDGGSSFLQVVDVPRLPNIAVGDSVRILGRTVMQAGQPMLQADSVPPVILVGRAEVPVAQVVSTGVAASAGGGPMDAALVRIEQAEIVDRVSVGQDLLITVDDGSGPVEVMLRQFLGRTTEDLLPDTTLRIAHAVGMLSPHDGGAGTIAWRFLVRSAGELVTETRRADLGVTSTFDPATAGQGQITQLRVVVSNAGPLEANGVQVTDTLAAVLSRQTSTATNGSYSSSGSAGVWTLDRLAPGASDTLTISVMVTGSGPGSASHIARAGGLVTELDPNPGNDRATSLLTLTGPDQ